MKLIDTDNFSIHEIQDKNGFKHRIIFVKDVEDTTTVERQRGKWVDPDGSYDKKIWRKCSNCGKHVKKFEIINYSLYENRINFCPNCGAEMEVEEWTFKE